MIRDFWVENYLSIRDRQSLSFVAKGREADITSSKLVIRAGDGTYLYKLGIFYGANASGKSNILWAINQIFRLMVMPNVYADDKVRGYFPFAGCEDKPTKMCVSFYYEDVRYDYEVAFNADCILHEELIYYPKGTKSLFYERDYVGEGVQPDVKFGVSLRLLAKTQDCIKENTLNNHSVLSVCNKTVFREDIEPFWNLHKWLLKHCHEVDGDYYNTHGDEEILREAYDDADRREFFLKMLGKADLNVAGFRPAGGTVVFESRIGNAAEAGQAGKGGFEVPLSLMSKGTRTYIRMLDKLYDLVTGRHLYCLDELGDDIHFDLIFLFLCEFMENDGESQLLITSHETALLTEAPINRNRGVTWFVEKDPETGSSIYNRGDSFGLHKNLTLYNSYIAGRLGARPRLDLLYRR